MYEKVLFMADCHIRPRTWTNYMHLQGDAYSALDKISDRLQSMPSPPEVLIIGGDWFDSNRPCSADLKQSFKFLSQFKSILYIRGNHDKVDPSFLDSINEISDGQLTLLNLDDGTGIHCFEDNFYIAGVNWIENAADLKNRLRTIASEFAKYANDHVLHLVMHTSFQHLLGHEGSYKICIKDIEEIFDGMQVRVLVGDIHTRDLTHISNLNGSYIHSPGSLYPCSFDKADEDYAVSLLHTDTGQITDIDCQVRLYYKYLFKDKKELGEMVDIAKEEGAQLPLSSFVRVVVPKDSDVKIMQSEYPDVICQIISEGSEEADSGSTAAGSQDQYTLSQAVSEEADEDPDIQELAVALVESDDPLATIESWLEFWKVERIS